MALESVTDIYDLVTTNPTSGDPKAQGDDHIRNIKTAIAASFAGSTGASGYQKIGHLEIQWGQATFAAATGNVTFGRTFGTACIFFSATDVGSTSTFQGVAGTLGVSSATTVTFSSNPGTFYWIAIGY